MYLKTSETKLPDYFNQPWEFGGGWVERKGRGVKTCSIFCLIQKWPARLDTSRRKKCSFPGLRVITHRGRLQNFKTTRGGTKRENCTSQLLVNKYARRNCFIGTENKKTRAKVKANQ